MKTMTQGEPGRLIMGFALPLMLGNIFQQLYLFVDTMIAGRVLGINALAALGAVEWMNFLLFGGIQGITQGFSVIIAHYYGARNNELLYKSIKNSVYLSMIGAVLFTLLGETMVRPMLVLLKTPVEAQPYAKEYLFILYGGTAVTVAYNLGAAILRALGDSKTPLKAMTVAAVCNVVLDVFFMYNLGGGIRGAAYATLLSQVLAFGVCISRLKCKVKIKAYFGCLRPDKDMVLSQLKTGLPMGLQSVITAAGGLAVQSVVNGFGILFLAGYTAACKLYGLLESAAASYGFSISVFAAQNKGAGNYPRIRQGLRSACLMGIATAVMMSLVMLLFGRFVLKIFITGNNSAVSRSVAIGYEFLIILAIFFPLLYILYILRSCIQGMGNTLVPMISSSGQLLMRLICAYAFTGLIGHRGIFWGEVTAWMIAVIILVQWYLRKMY